MGDFEIIRFVSGRMFHKSSKNKTMEDSTKKSMERYLKISREYLYAADLLFDAYEERGHFVLEDESCRPLFYLLGHAYECALKAKIQQICPREEKELRTHDLRELLKIIKENGGVEIGQEIESVLFYLANSHCADSGETLPNGKREPKKTYDDRYGDYKFCHRKFEEKEQALLEKQRKQGLSADEPVSCGISNEIRKELEPELTNYCSYMAASFQGRPEPKKAIKLIEELLKNMEEKKAA